MRVKYTFSQHENCNYYLLLVIFSFCLCLCVYRLQQINKIRVIRKNKESFSMLFFLINSNLIKKQRFIVFSFTVIALLKKNIAQFFSGNFFSFYFKVMSKLSWKEKKKEKVRVLFSGGRPPTHILCRSVWITGPTTAHHTGDLQHRNYCKSAYHYKMC